MDSIFTILGVAGSVLCILMYFFLERGYAKSTDIWYYACNGIGALLILAGAMYSFDGGDLGAVTQEVCWAGISGIGVYRMIKNRQAKKKEMF